MSSLTNNTTNRISSSSITTSNTTYSQSSSSFNNNNTTNTTNDCDTSISSSSSSNTLGLAAMGLAAASLAAVTANNSINSDNPECDSKRNVSTPFKLHSNTSDDPYASFYALNRTLPPPSSTSTGTSPFNIISQSPNNNLQFVSNPTG